MVSQDFTVKNPTGIHARPAGELVKLCKNYKETAITIAVGDKSAKATKLLAIMGLGATKGTEVTFSFDGPDEEAACAAVEEFMKANL